MIFGIAELNPQLCIVLLMTVALSLNHKTTETMTTAIKRITDTQLAQIKADPDNHLDLMRTVAVCDHLGVDWYIDKDFTLYDCDVDTAIDLLTNDRFTDTLDGLTALTYSEAYEFVVEYIKETIWAFRPEFLMHYMPDGMTVDAIELLQQGCESANGPLLALIADFDEFVSDAIGADGFAIFLETYDGDEHEYSFFGIMDFYIYRMD